MKKSLGQHFLVNKTAIKKIVAVLDLRPKDTIIEIGPGRGELTLPIAKECQELGCKIIAIEKDPKLAKKLGENIQLPITNFQMIEGDVLRILPKLIRDWKLEIRNWKLIGNIPYYITGQLLRILSELPNKPLLAVLMLQKEVAQRVVAKPPRMNLLAAAVQFWAEPNLLFTLKPKDFSPPPKVESAVIQLEKREERKEKREVENYYKMIRIIFKQPRKTLLNNLQKGLQSAGWRTKTEVQKTLKTLKIDPQSRPQNLSIEDCSRIARLFMV